MDSLKPTFIREKSNIIPIPLDKKIYDLKTSFFDPSKSSPPNDFILKLNQRIQIYESQPLEKKYFNFTKT